MVEDLAYIIEKFGLEKVPPEWFKTWETSMLAYPGDNNLRFIQDAYILEANKTVKLPEDALKAILETASAIRNDNCLSKLAWHSFFMTFSTNEFADTLEIDSSNIYFPSSRKFNKAFNGLFNVIVLLAGLEAAVKKHGGRGISNQITLDTFSDLELWMRHYRSKYGIWGMEEQNWLANHFNGKIFRLGRLQFMPRFYKGQALAFRNIRNKKVLAFSEPEIRYRGDGQVDGTNDIFDSEGSWLSQLSVNEEFIEGNLISPYGYAVRGVYKILMQEWEEILSKGDPVLDIHIPEGERMSHEICGESLKMAKKFFATHFPERTFKAFVCSTWLFDSQFQSILPPYSNIVRFQREFYLYPYKGSDFQVFERVFGSKPKDLSKAPRDSSLRRGVLDFVIGGGHFRDAGGFIPIDDLNWGGEIFQRDWDVS